MQPHVLKPRRTYLDQFKTARLDTEASPAAHGTNKATRVSNLPKSDATDVLSTLQDKHAKMVAHSALKESDKELNELGNMQTKERWSRDLRIQESVERTLEKFEKDNEQVEQLDDQVIPVLTRESIDTATDYCKSSSNTFTRMTGDYANALNLNDFERKCLGFNENNTDTVLQNKISNESKLTAIESVKTQEQNWRKVPQHVFDEPSAWDTLIDTISMRNWFSSDPNNNQSLQPIEKNQKTEEDVDQILQRKEDVYEIVRNEDDVYEIVRNEEDVDDIPGNKESMHAFVTGVDPFAVFTMGILDTIDQICEEDHVDGVRNCFKCQYKETFKSFTINYLQELDNIWNYKELSTQQQDEQINETLEMWIYQLSEQNLSLAGAYNTSVQSSDKLKRVLFKSRNSMRNLQKERDKDKASIDALNYELSLRDKTIKKLRHELEMKLEQTKVMEESLQNTQGDVNSLTELVLRLRDKGVWDIHGLPLGDETSQKIFSEDYYLHGAKVIGHKEFSSKKREWRNEIDQLKSEGETLRAIIAAKDKEIQRFKTTDPMSTRFKNVAK